MANWEGVIEFVTVAETASFTLAAEKLATSVAQISRKISTLETKLAIKLFNRTTRQVSLTEAGTLYYQHCQPLIEGLNTAELAVTQMQKVPTGLIKVTAPITYGEQKIAPLLNDFLHLYPNVELELILTNQKLDLVEHGIDLAIRLGRLQDSSLISKRLSSRSLHVCASPSYLAQKGEPKTLSDLSRYQCLLGENRQWRFKLLGKNKNIMVHGKIKYNSGIALTSAALSGLGLIQLPDYYVEEYLKSGKLVEVLTNFAGDKEGIWALYPNNRHLSPKVRLLIDHLTEALSSN